MKVLFAVYHGLGFGGAEVSTKYLAEGLKQRGHEVIFASHGHYEGFQNYPLAAYKSIPLFSLQRKLLERSLRRIIKREKPDVVHAHDRITSVAAVRAARKIGIPVVVHFRDYWVACPRSSCVAPDGFAYDVCTPEIIFKHYPFWRCGWELYKLLALKAARKVVQQADVKFCNGKMIQRRLELCGVSGAKVLNILRDLSQFSPRIMGGKMQKKFGLRQHIILFVGGLTKTKGVDFITDVMVDILQQHSDWCFLIAGEGPLESSLQQMIQESRMQERIVLAGKIPLHEMPSVYRDAAFVVFPSQWEEPLSGVLLEAGAMEMPVIASDRGESKEIIADGQTGMIVAAEDKDAWKGAILTMMRQPRLREAMGKAAAERIQKHYSIEHVSGIVEKTYSSGQY